MQSRACSHQYASSTNRSITASLCSRRPPAAAARAAPAATPAPSRLLSVFWTGPRGCGPARLTNTQDELDPYREEDDEFIELSQLQIPNPELGPLERRVNNTYLEALESEAINPEDIKYWFEPPQGGWNQEKLRLHKAQEVPYEPATGRNPGPGRVPMDRFHVGQEIRGEVSRVMLYAGAQVDFGAEFDGLIPVEEAQWIQGVRDRLEVGAQVRARIHAVRDPSWFRFPVQLELLDPPLGALLSPPDEHEPPVDLRGKASDLTEYERATGREYNRYRYWMDMGVVDEDADVYDDDSDAEGDGEPEFSEDIERAIRNLAKGLPC